jgi:hypothetical protein
LIAFYLYYLQPPPWVAIALLVTFALLTFVPLRYLYPTQRGKLNQITSLLGAIWTIFPLWILLQPKLNLPWLQVSPSEFTRGLAIFSLFFPIYYLIASWYVSWKLRVTRRSARAQRRG